MSTVEPIGASENGPSRRPFERTPALTTTALRAALQAQLRSRRHADDPELRRLARIISAEAHRRSMRCEQVVVQLKQAWLTLDEAADPPGRGHAVLIERLVSLCVEEFYQVTDDR